MTERRNLVAYLRRARKIGIKPATFYNRVRRGWTPERAATTPPRQYFYEWSHPHA